MADRNHMVVDLLRPTSVRSALTGCNAVIHCAFDFLDMAVNRRIALTLARECAAVGARLVHVSTASVYEPLPDGELYERDGTDGRGSDYKHVKLEIENDLLDLIRDVGLDVVILQPAVVYGPFGRAWTDSPVRELLTGTVILPEDGNGFCNAVYIDDVCQAVIAAVTAPLTSGERILVSGLAPVAWKEFYGAYQDILGVDSLRLQPLGAQSISAAQEDDGTAVHQRKPMVRIKGLITRMLGTRRVTRLNVIVSYMLSFMSRERNYRPTDAQLALFRARCHIRTDKAKRLLGYDPRFDLRNGMRMTAPYIVRAYGRLARTKTARSQPSSQRQEGRSAPG
jgi:nucleoside-diphosphate-sugar epimerase